MGRRYNIEELCRIVGVKRRTVHFYVQEKLLPPPAGRGMGGFYDERHVAILHEILRLRKEGRSLAAIGGILRSESDNKEMVAGMVSNNDLAAVPCEVPSTDKLISNVCVRFTVACGVEILVSQEIAVRTPMKVRRLLEAAKAIIEAEDWK